jgi:hypothetical protein
MDFIQSSDLAEVRIVNARSITIRRKAVPVDPRNEINHRLRKNPCPPPSPLPRNPFVSPKRKPRTTEKIIVAINPAQMVLPSGNNLILKRRNPDIKSIKGRQKEDIPNHLFMKRLDNQAPNFPPQFSTFTSGPENTADQSKL